MAFGKKKKEKGIPFWKRGKKQQEETVREEIDLEAVGEEAAAADSVRIGEEIPQVTESQATELEPQEEAVADFVPAAEEMSQTEDVVVEPETAGDIAPEISQETEPEQEQMCPPGQSEETTSQAASAAEESPELTEEQEKKKEKKGFFAKIRDGLKKTKDAMISRLQQVVGSFTKIDDDLFDELEEILITSDMGPETSVEICDTLRKRVKERGVTDPGEIMGMIQEIITEMLGEDQTLEYPTKPTVIMVIGVNGAGKTTTIGKLCHQLKSEGKKVLVAAADTFRAAAIDQLEVWTERAGVDIVKHSEGSDPASVVFDAIDAAKARNCDVLICDTAGRLHNKKNLMQELAKINRIITQRAEGCHTEILLVLDATTGQNAVNQARLFQEVANITGIVLTKLDGTAKGGIIVSIHNELKIPVKLVGVGEKIDDLQPFCGADFVRALFSAEEEK